MKIREVVPLFGCLIALSQPALAGDNPPSSSRTLESRDKLDNTKIQTLMSDYKRANKMNSSIRKKLDDTKAGTIGKI